MSNQFPGRTTRRRFAFWVGFSLFSLGERLRANAFDELAAATMQAGEGWRPVEDPTPQERWTAAENAAWRWFERESFRDGKWKLTGITTPIHKATGEPLRGCAGYLDESLVPESMRRGYVVDGDQHYAEDGDAEGQPHADRRARDGRPPSKWLRSLNAEELRVWLKTINVPEVGVGGMTFWVHLTRDHAFDPAKIEGLTEAEQAKLHSAAHYGY